MGIGIEIDSREISREVGRICFGSRSMKGFGVKVSKTPNYATK
jgi:hypothetical protein